MKITIEAVNNGWVVTYVDAEANDNGDFVDVNKMVVVEQQEDYTNNKNECIAIRNLLYTVMEQLGLNGSKHNAYRVFVKIEAQNDAPELGEFE